MEPFQSGSNTYSFDDANGTQMLRDKAIFIDHINQIFSLETTLMQQRIQNVKNKVSEWNNEIAGYRNTSGTDRCKVDSNTRDGPLSAKGARCDEIQYDLVPNGQKYISYLTTSLSNVLDARDNWITMLNEGVVNFMNDYRDVSSSFLTIPINSRYEGGSSINVSSIIGNQTAINEQMPNIISSIKNIIVKLVEDVYTAAVNKGSNSIWYAAADVKERIIKTQSLDEMNNILGYAVTMYNILSDGPFRKDLILRSIEAAKKFNLSTPLPVQGNYTRPMPVVGTLTSKNQEELATSAALVKRIWLATPSNLEKYIYVNPDTMTPYVRPPTATAPFTSDMKCMITYTVSADGSTYTFNEYANNFNKRFCITEIKPDLLAMLPVPAQSFISSYIQSRRRRISEIVIRSNKDYQAAATAFQRYQNDLSGQSLKILASNIKDKINGSSSKGISQYGGSKKKNIYLTRMILENKYEILPITSSDKDYTDASAAYTKYTTDLKNDSNLTSISIEGLIDIYLPSKSKQSQVLLSAMLIASDAAVNTVDTAENDFKAAQDSRRQYVKDLAGNTVLKATSSSEKVSTYVGGNNTLTKSYFTIILQINSTDIGLIDKESTDYKNANNAFVACISVAADANLSIEEKVRKYIGSGSAIAKAIFAILIGSKEMEKVSFNMPPSILPTPYFKNRKSIIYDQIAQGFYNLGDGTKSMTYIYDIFPIGSSIIDVRFDLKINIPPAGAVAQMKALTKAYRDQLVQNLSVNQRQELISKYQTAYEKLRDPIADAPGGLTPGATRRFFYTLTDNTLTINAIAQDQAAAGSFYTQYNCGLETSTGDLPGKINYTPITNYTQNASDPLDCTNKATLIQIGIDYVDALNADMADALQTVSNPWDQNSNLYVTKILGVKQLTPLSCNLQWEETAFDYLTNKAGPARVRNVLVSYLQNSSSWFATDIIFDASGFKYLSSAPTGLTMLNPPMVLPPPYIDDAKLDDGGICPKVSCSDPVTLYKMIDEYNTNDDNPGVILKVVKAVTMNTGQCDLLVDMDYTTRPNEDNNRLEGTFREQISLLLSLDIPTCKYNLIDYDIGYGIQDQTPLMTDNSGNNVSFDYLLKFGVNVLNEISKAANSVTKKAKSAYDSALSTLTKYRETTYARTGNIENFNGCPRVRCQNIEIMSAIFNGYDTTNKFKNRMGKIIQVANSLTNPNSCDVFFENQPITGWNDESGTQIYGSSQTRAARFTFISDVGSSYNSIYEAQIEDLSGRLLNASPADAASIRQKLLDISNEKADINSQVSCSFTVSNITPIPIISPTSWAKVTDLSQGLPVLNPSKNDLSSEWNLKLGDTTLFPYPNPFPPLAIDCMDYRLINTIRSKSIERRGTSVDQSYVVGYSIDTSVPGEITTTDITDSGVNIMTPQTLIYSRNIDNQTCAVEMTIKTKPGRIFSVHRQYQFDIDKSQQYRIKSMNALLTMPPNIVEKGYSSRNTPTYGVYTEFRDIKESKVYPDISYKAYSKSASTNKYSYTKKPIALNIDISNEIPLIINPDCKNLDFSNLSDVSIALKYNGYPAAYAIASMPNNKYEIRMTDNEYLPFGSTYKVVSFYTRKNSCNPIINTIQDSNPAISVLSLPVGSIGLAENLTAVRQYFNIRYSTYLSDLSPKRLLGQIWSGGVDINTKLYVYSATVGEYDANGDILDFYGYPQNNYEANLIPRIYLACEFRRRFSAPYTPYVANLYILRSMPSNVRVITSSLVDPSPVILDDPFKAMTSYKYLEFIPLAVRSVPNRPNKMCQLTRIEFYIGNTIQTLTGSVDGSVLVPGYTAQQSMKGFTDIFKTDGQTMDPTRQSVFLCLSGSSIFASSTKPLAIDGLSFITGKDPAFDIVRWKLRGSMNNRFWKNLYTSPLLVGDSLYPAYGYWRIPIMSFSNISVPLPQNSSRPIGFTECKAAVNTLNTIETLSAFTYGTYSKAFFKSTFSESEKNLNRVYLRDLSDMAVDDFNDTVYIRAKVQTMDSTYTLTAGSVIFALSFTRSTKCVQSYNITTVTASDLLNAFQASAYSNPGPTRLTALPIFTEIVISLGSNDVLPYAYKGYPTVLDKQYKPASLSFDPSSIPPCSISSFKTNGPNRSDPATNTINVNPAMTAYTNISPEGAAQMCADNTECIGMSVNGMSGAFVGKPTASNRIVFTASVGSFYFKSAYTFTRCVRFRSLVARNGNTLALSKIAFYNGSQMVSNFEYDAGSCYTINADGSPSGVAIMNGFAVSNLLNYASTAGWQSSGVNGILLTFKTPLNFDGYTLVTASSSADYDPVSWIIETGMQEGGPWTRFEQRAYTGSINRVSSYPIFRQNKDSLVSTDFTAKTLSSCGTAYSCQNLLPQITQLYIQQKAPNGFYVDAIGYDMTTNQCIIGWDDNSGNGHTTGFTFKPIFGDCKNIKEPENITIKELAGATGLNRMPYTAGSTFTYARFKPTALNSGRGTHLSFLGLLNKGSIITPISVVNMAGGDRISAGNLQNTNLSQEWQSNNLGNVKFTYPANTVADAFSMITGNATTNSPVSWVLEASTDGIIWYVLHEQVTAVTAPAARRQYPTYGFDGSITSAVKGILDKTLKDQGLQCDSREIIDKVNTNAFDNGILFNPVSYIYDDSKNQCTYQQAGGSSVIASFLTRFTSAQGALGGLNTTCTGTTLSSGITGGTPFVSGLKGIDDSTCQPVACDNPGLLGAIDSFYQKTRINTSNKSFSATKTAFDPKQNECIFELDSMFAPIDTNNNAQLPNNRIGFQIQKNTGCTVPGTSALIINNNISNTQSLSEPSLPSGPYRFIRFKPTEGRMNISSFEFFNKTNTLPNYTSLRYSATVTNPLGSTRSIEVTNSNLGQFRDYLSKPLQFTFNPPLNFSGYSWTTDSEPRNMGPTKWILQVSTNGYIWNDLHSGSWQGSTLAGSPMPVYWLDGSVPISRAVVQAAKTSWTLGDRGITCAMVQSAAFTAIANDPNVNSDTNGFTLLTSKYNNTSNTCEFNINDSASGQITAVVTYAKAASQADTTATITTVVIS